MRWGAGLRDSQPLWNLLPSPTRPHLEAGERGAQGLTYQFAGKRASPAEPPTEGPEGRVRFFPPAEHSVCLWPGLSHGSPWPRQLEGETPEIVETPPSHARCPGGSPRGKVVSPPVTLENTGRT